MEIFSVVVLIGALVVLIPTARRVFKKGDDEWAGPRTPDFRRVCGECAGVKAARNVVFERTA